MTNLKKYMENNEFSNKNKKSRYESMQRSYVALDSKTTKIKSAKADESSQQRFKAHNRNYSESKVARKEANKPKVPI